MRRWSFLLPAGCLAIGLLAACSRQPETPPEATVAAPLTPFDAWQQAREAVRRSPDHLPAQAEALVARRDAAALLAFVRDRIATYPPSADGFDRATTARRWGSRMTLRGGAGTPREKVELLAELYERAGFEVRRLQGRADPRRIDGRQVLFREVPRTFDHNADAATLAAWKRALQPPVRTRRAIDADGAQARALAAKVAAHFPDAAAPAFDFAVGEVPLLEVNVGGQWRFANPIGAPLELGEAGTLGAPARMNSAPGPVPDVRVSLEAARSDDPYRRFPLVSARYGVEQLAGRRIHVGFAPPIPGKRLAAMSPEHVDAFVPVIGLVGHDLSAEEAKRFAVAGAVLTRGGDVVSRKDGRIAINGAVLADADPAAVQRVQRLELRAQPGDFPRVRVALRALDGEGRPVDRLPASAFALQEDGQPRSFTLLRNEARPPRVVLLFDVSTSMPEAFRVDGVVGLAERLADRLYDAWPQAQVQVAAIGFGARLPRGGWATTRDAAKAQAAQLRQAIAASEIWRSLADVQELQPTVVVMVSDGDTTDELTAPARAALSRGAPVFSLAVGAAHEDTLAQASRLSNGRHMPVAQADEALDAALAEITARQSEGYELVYEAPAQGGDARQVAVALAQAKAEAGYTVPATRTVPQALSGLYLTISVGGRSHTTTLAGHRLPHAVPGGPGITQAELGDVRGALFGRALIAVEGAAPGPSQVLDAWYADKLSLRRLFDAVQARDDDGVIAAWEQGLSRTPSALALAFPPLPGASDRDALTFETTPRIAAVFQKITPGGPYTRQLSYFPLAQWRTAAADPRRAWRRTLEASAGLAVVEANLLKGTSTLKAVDGKPLRPLGTLEAARQPALDEAARAAWIAMTRGLPMDDYRLVAPREPDGAWLVHTGSGSMIGLLPDGTGGSAEEVCAQYKAASRMLSLAGAAGSLANVELGPWGALAQWEIDNLTNAILVIGYGKDDRGMVNPGVAIGCAAASDGLGEAIPAYGHYGTLSDILDGAGVDAGLPSLCPQVNPCE